MTRRNSRAELEQWFQSVDVVLADQREHAISPSTVPSSGRDRTSWTMTLRVLGRDLVRLIDTLVESPGRWILILDVGETGGRYVQLLVHEDGSILYEASSNNFLEGRDCLNSQQERMLESMGSTAPGGRNRPNWWAVEATIYPETKAVALHLLETLKMVFSVGSSDIINARLISSPRRSCSPASQSLNEPSLSECPAGVRPESRIPISPWRVSLAHVQKLLAQLGMHDVSDLPPEGGDLPPEGGPCYSPRQVPGVRRKGHESMVIPYRQRSRTAIW